MKNLTIKKLDTHSAHLLDKIAPGVFDNAIRTDQRDAFISSPNHHMFLGLVEGLVVGMASGFVYFHPDKDPSMVVLEVGVGDDWRRKGIAKQLMKALLDAAEARGCEEAWLGTEPDNAEALALYRSLEKGEESQMVVFSFNTRPG